MRVLLLISILTGSFDQPNVYGVTSTHPTAPDRRQAIVELVGTLRVVTSGETWRTPSPETVKVTFRRLIAISRKSRVARRAVIAALVETFQSDPSDTRFYIAHLLSQLKAVETLDLIVRELDQKGLLPSMLSLNTAPMVDAIVGFGEAAVPYLEKALAVERLSLKQKACIALGEIGGAKAKRCLERALQRESDQDVIWFIKDGLQEIVRKRCVKERRASP